MSDLVKVKLSMVLFSARFWIATFVLFFTNQGISLSETYTLIGIYYVASLLLEYPTGVIGDHYSHRLSVGLGYGILAISYLLFLLSSGFSFYLTVLLLVALGQALISGSDTALLHGISKDFERDYSDTKTLTLVSAFLAITIGGWVATYDIRYPILLTSLALFPASALVFSTKRRVTIPAGDANIFKLGKGALNFVWTSPATLPLLFLAATVSGFFFSYKWIYNPIFEAIRLPLGWWGVVAGTAILFIAVGTKSYRHIPMVQFTTVIILIAVSIAASGLFSLPILVVLGLVSSHVFRGYFETKLTIDLNKNIVDSYRSSILSIKGIFIRVVSGIYIFIGALMVRYVPLSFFLFGSASVILFMGISAILLRKNLEKNMLVPQKSL